jgi:uncharacterized tellurite resistance protein B-like protein
MNVLNIFDHPEKKQNKDYFVQLVRSAKADDTIHDSEMAMLQRLGKKLGLTEPEISTLIRDVDKTDYIPPYELERKFEQVYNIVSIALADGIVDDREMRVLKGFALRSGFSEEEIPGLMNLIVDGIRNSKNEEDLFVIYREKIRSGKS